MSSQTSISNGGYPAGTKFYRAGLTQTGTSPPVANILTNTLGGVPTWSRVGTGNYNLTLQGAFPKTRTIATSLNQRPNGNPLGVLRLNDNTIEVTTSVESDLDGGLFIQIVVYPP